MEPKVKARKQTVEQKDANLLNSVVIQRVFSLPVASVWKALTEDEYFKKW